MHCGEAAEGTSGEADADAGDVIGPLGVNYLALYYCQAKGYEGLIMCLFLLLTVYLIYLRKIRSSRSHPEPSLTFTSGADC
jgi:hypothetical protein